MATSRQRRLWLLAGVYLAAIYGSLYPLQFALDALRARGLLRISIAAVFLGGAALAVAWGWRRRWRPAQWGVAAVGAGLFAAIATRFDVIQERLHLVEYGLLAGLLREAWRARWAEPEGGLPPRRRWTAAAAALATTAAAGWLDEGIQWLLPNRVYDLRDVVLNAASGLLALAVLEAIESVGGSERPGAGAR